MFQSFEEVCRIQNHLHPFCQIAEQGHAGVVETMIAALKVDVQYI